MLREQARQESLALRASRHRRALEPRRRFEPRRGNAIVQLDAVHRDGIAPKGFDGRKGSEHRLISPKRRRALHQTNCPARVESRSGGSRAQAELLPTPGQGTFRPGDEVVAHPGAEWFWMKRRIVLKDFN